MLGNSSEQLVAWGVSSKQVTHEGLIDMRTGTEQEMLFTFMTP
jgi:hypothetical protein